MIRRATPDDVPAIAALERLLFGPDAWSEPQVAEELSAVGRETLVAVAEAGVWSQTAGAGPDGLRFGTKPPPPGPVGYLVTRLIGDVADLQRVGVHPGHQRTGVAAALLAAALERPSARMLLEVAESNTGARAFYDKHGFVEIDRRKRYYRDGSDALVLERLAHPAQ